MTKEEILFKHSFKNNGRIMEQKEWLLEAMDEYGKQCFEAGIKACIYYYKDIRINPSYPFDIDKFWNDYLKELENEKRKD
jgi:hypothetical protein